MAAVVLSVLAMTGQSAAAASSATPLTTPDIASAKCTAADVWLKVTGSTGVHCYTGKGSLVVDLPGVDRFQVIGAHSGSIGSSGHVFVFSGAGTREISPPITVIEITINT